MRWLLGFALLCSQPALAAPASKIGEQTTPLPEPGWIKIDRWQKTIGSYEIKVGSGFIVDLRLSEPIKALEACRLYNGDRLKYRATANSFGCVAFLSPSMRTLSQASEAISIYEVDFQGAKTPADRIVGAMDRGVGEYFEMLTHATPAILNSLRTWGQSKYQATIGEEFASDNQRNPELIQWLFDKGAKPCTLDFPIPQSRFTCLQFYTASDQTYPREGIMRVLDVLERNGFRPRSNEELREAARLMRAVTPKTPSQLRYLDLIFPAVRLRMKAIAADIARQEAEASAKYNAEEHAKLIESTAQPHSSTEANSAAAVKLAQVGLPVCQILRIDGRDFVFRATVEGYSKTKLQLRAASIRNNSTDIVNQPYRDTRISPGVIFWDGAALWRGEC